jgi:outer membrane beta-barrel protein
MRNVFRESLWIGILTGILCSTAAFAAKKEKAAAPQAAAESTEGGAEEADVDKIKSKYWAQGDESQLGVVQNRAYSKAKKFELGLGVGKTFNDPFLNLLQYEGSFGYNFNEYWALSARYMHYNVSGSGALDKLEDSGKKANTVEPEYYAGLEGTGSFLYGKLSLLGKSIIYYDMHFSAGAGATKTENDSAAPTVSLGIGQRFYITQSTSLRMDYRAMTYEETVVEKEISKKLGQEVGKRRSWNHSVGLSLNFMFGGN